MLVNGSKLTQTSSKNKLGVSQSHSPCPAAYSPGQEHRGNGYGKSIIKVAISRLWEEGVPAVMLTAADAHDAYEKFSFSRIGNSPKLMRYVRA